MTSSFILTLDTTGPADVVAELAGGAAITPTADVNLHVTTSDVDTTGYQIKVWGDLGNGATTEAAATWQNYNVDNTIALSDGDGLKTVNVKLRDDVGNESAVATDTISVNTLAPTITITADPTRTKVSKVDGWDETSFAFAADQPLQAWEVSVVPSANSAQSEGVVIPTLGGSQYTSGGAMDASVPQTVIIKGVDLERAAPGDGDKIVKVFGQDIDGAWSA